MTAPGQRLARNGSALRVMIAGGGTGGHLYMGVAVAREMQKRDPGHSILFVGTRRGLEARIVPAEGFRLEFISSSGLKGMGMWRAARNFLIIPQSLLQSRRLICGYRPHVVVGVGGYSSGPVVLAAWWLGKPTLILEPNAYPGLTNRWLSRVADRAALAIPEAAPWFGAKGVLTGIPVRREFLENRRRSHIRGSMTLLIYGGSQGSHALNTVVCGALPGLKSLGPDLRLIHQTGVKELEAVRDAYRRAGVEGDVRAFLPRIYEEFGVADLIISRAGASTIAELAAAGKAALLVPFPGASDNHQTKNAQALERAGAARMVPEEDLEPGRLEREIRYYWDHPEEIERMEMASQKLSRPDAAQKIVDLMVELSRSLPTAGARPERD